MIGKVPDHLLDAAYLALQEGRLHYRCTNAQGRPCNGGDADPIPLGEWSPEVPDAEICERGWHLTTDPLLWRGTRVWICEGEGLAGQEGDKTCWRRIRPLAEVDPKTAICWRARVAAMRPDLRGADLRNADLRGAVLRGPTCRTPTSRMLIFGVPTSGTPSSETGSEAPTVSRGGWRCPVGEPDLRPD